MFQKMSTQLNDIYQSLNKTVIQKRGNCCVRLINLKLW